MATETVLGRARESGLLRHGEPVIVLLSGGRDSVCLLDVACTTVGPDAIQALHINYGLRPAADRDQQHCQELCEQLGVELRVYQAPTPPAQGNFQDWAREFRYAAARELAAEDAAKIAVAHTATDRVETVLYRLAASPGRRALLAMRAVEGPVIRPLLAVTRTETAAYCESRGLSWCEDETNASDRYARNRVRNRLVPALESVHPAAGLNVLRTSEILAEEAEVLDDLVDTLLAGRSQLPVGWLCEQPRGLRRLLIRELAERTLGRPFATAGTRGDELLTLGDQPGRRSIDLGDGVKGVVARGELSFTQTEL